LPGTKAGTPTAGKLARVFIIAYLEDKKPEAAMSQTTTMTVRISGALSEFVASNVGENGSYENISEYVRDLIRRDKERAEAEAFNRLKAELTRAFAAPEESYRPLTAAEVIARNRG
jgi:antitoxin ParD1/3/4